MKNKTPSASRPDHYDATRPDYYNHYFTHRHHQLSSSTRRVASSSPYPAPDQPKRIFSITAKPSIISVLGKKNYWNQTQQRELTKLNQLAKPIKAVWPLATNGKRTKTKQWPRYIQAPLQISSLGIPISTTSSTEPGYEKEHAQTLHDHINKWCTHKTRDSTPSNQHVQTLHDQLCTQDRLRNDSNQEPQTSLCTPTVQEEGHQPLSLFSPPRQSSWLTAATVLSNNTRSTPHATAIEHSQSAYLSIYSKEQLNSSHSRPQLTRPLTANPHQYYN